MQIVDTLPKMPVRARAPLRLGLAGGGTDLSPYTELFGGAVLNVTIDRFAYASVAATDNGRVLMRAADLDLVEEEGGLDQIPTAGFLALHRAVYNRVVRDFCGGRGFGAKITTTIDAPPGSGLGSSSALVVALVDAFRLALRLPLGRYDVAHLAFEIERLDLGLAGGKQDHYAAGFGGMNFIEFLSSDRVIVNPLRVAPAIVNELQASIVICFTGQSRASDEIIREQISSIVNNSDAVEKMHRLKADAIEMKQALLRGDIVGMAAILDRSWQSKKATAKSISNSRIESLWDVAHRNGAMAGKVSGAGGGGFIIFLCNPDERFRLMRALQDNGASPSGISFTENGVESWSTDTGSGSSKSSMSPATF